MRIPRLPAVLLLAASLAGPAYPDLEDAAWEDLFSRLGARGAVTARFTESRWTPVRNRPVVLEGELRTSPGLGLSLHYAGAGGRTLIADADGVLLRDARGRDRAIPADSPGAAVARLLLPLLRFDLAAIRRDFSAGATRDGPGWRLELEPLAAELAASVRRVGIAGEETRVTRLRIDRGPAGLIEIEIGETHVADEFPPEEAERYFRAKRR